MTYPRVSTTWCSKHRPKPINLRHRIRKALHRSYKAEQVHCDCTGGNVIKVPDNSYEGFHL